MNTLGEFIEKKKVQATPAFTLAIVFRDLKDLEQLKEEKDMTLQVIITTETVLTILSPKNLRRHRQQKVITF
jgi:hypothetical protein